MRSTSLGFSILLAALTATLLYGWSTDGLVQMASEAGTLETLHMVILGCTAIAYLYGFFNSSDHWKTAAATLAIGAAAACIREFEFDQYKDVDWIRSLRQMKLHWLALLIGSLPLLAHIWRHVTEMPAATLLAFQPNAWPLMLSGALLGSALLVDHFNIANKNHILEEIFETYGYAFVLFAAWRHTPLAEINGAGLGKPA